MRVNARARNTHARQAALTDHLVWFTQHPGRKDGLAIAYRAARFKQQDGGQAVDMYAAATLTLGACCLLVLGTRGTILSWPRPRDPA